MAMKQRRPPEKRGGRHNGEGKAVLNRDGDAVRAGKSACATRRLAEDVFDLVEKAGGMLGRRVFHFHGLAELIE
jgi:hypothetical protein